ncbi:hypothetical protein J437_LFUL011480 [Ladona fulva]|uniref:Uncharacterized protein n=1 Tax=Ladona fulva TaxID=123851 RepID=A0A8K0KAM8_LADFU|nr:hypothetical protein J437_LFUL011480 [Ladona fulva]
MRAAFEKDKAEWKEKEERLEKELAEAKVKLSSKTSVEEEKFKSLEKENNSLKKEVEDALAKLASVQNNRPNEISDAVKSAMNSVYSHLQPKFSNGVAYEGLVVRKTLAATIREVTLQFLSSNNEEKGEESELHKGTLVKEVSTIRRKGNKPELKAKPDGRKILLRKGSSPRIDVEALPSSSHHSDMERNVGNSAMGHKESSKHSSDELSRSVDSNLTQRDGHEIKAKEESRSRVSSREGSLERVVNPEPPSPPIFDAGELSESGEEWLP